MQSKPQQPQEELQKKPSFRSEHDLFKRDLVCGAKAGWWTGIFIAPLEFCKVEKEVHPKIKIRQMDFKKLPRAVFPFPFLFATVIGLEFSVNDRLKEMYGKVAGILSSAITGAILLTPADHLMYRAKTQNYEQMWTSFRNHPKSLFIGFIPILIREIIFMTNVIYTGPRLGEILKGSSEASESEEKFWKYFGRLSCGYVAAFLSHPFDNLARQMQMKYSRDWEMKYSSNISGKTSMNSFSTVKTRMNDFSLMPTMRECIRRVVSEYIRQSKDYSVKQKIVKNPFLRGLMFRFFISPIAAASIGYLYEDYQNSYVY